MDDGEVPWIHFHADLHDGFMNGGDLVRTRHSGGEKRAISDRIK